MNREEFFNKAVKPIKEKIEDDMGINVKATVNGKEVVAYLIRWGTQPDGDVIKKGSFRFPKD